MSDSDWRDPFADDEAAREREARRAERERRRREQAEARESLGERVRDELEGERRKAEPQGPDRSTPAPRAEPEAEPPPARRPSGGGSSDRVHRRRLALLGVGALVVLAAGAGAVISGSGDDPPPAAPEKPRKTIEVTIPEGFDRSQVAKVARQAGLKGDYEKATRSSKAINLRRLGARGADSLEGFLFPATYELFKGDRVGALVRRQLEAFQQNLEGIDMSFAERKNLSVYDVVTIASMIEREIAVPDERKLAASVIYNRLEANNPLGIDATIRFEDRNYDEPLVESRLNEDTPYNTRTNPGLPPGPIGNPGLASLEAAAKPAKTDFFFYVIKPGTCNEHEFVETQAEFDAADARYNAARDEAGGKSPTEC